MKLTFHGAAGAVTGSNYLLESGSFKILIDCGLHQGSHFADLENFQPFAYNPKQIHAVLVTHAHIDHTGRLPKLFLDGFSGTVFSTPPTRDFTELILLDSEQILGKEAQRENKTPFCTTESISHVMHSWKTFDYHTPFEVGPFRVEFLNAGHILGSAIIRIEAEGKTIVFSGDLGNYPAPIIQPTDRVEKADYCILDSTYGDSLHKNVHERREELENAIEDTMHAGGVLMIPAFALERTQEILYHMHELFKQGRVPRVPVFVDSPLAIKLTAIYKKYERYFNEETSQMVRSGDDILNFPGLRLTLTPEESKGINDVPSPKIIIAGSGMSNGGRILHHELRYLPDPKSTILFVGYQAHGCLGRQIMEGARIVKIFGVEIVVRAKRKSISSYSAHADQEQLLRWLSPMRSTLKKVFAVHGEPETSAVLVEKIRDGLAVDAIAPKAGEEFVL